MNLQKLFEAQAVLDEHIMNEHAELRENESNLDWKLLALQVELGECANEWRGFKKWSKDQKPRIEILTTAGANSTNVIQFECSDEDCGEKFSKDDVRLKTLFEPLGVDDDCPTCKEAVLIGFRAKNPLLEEYVDCLHFILSIGLELDAEEDLDWDELSSDVEDVTEQFSMVFKKISELSGRINTPEWLWRDMFEEFYLLGKLLDFTWEQIEAAYFEKNKINHQRQESGY